MLKTIPLAFNNSHLSFAVCFAVRIINYFKLKKEIAYAEVKDIQNWYIKL